MCVPPGVGPFKNQLVLEICNWAKWWQLDPWFEISREFYAQPPTFPSRVQVLATRLQRLDAFEAVTADAERITGSTKTGVAVAIEKSGEVWMSRIGNETWRHAKLDNAVSWIEYMHMPAYLRDLVERAAPGSMAENVLS